MRRLVRLTGLQLIIAVVVTVFSMGLAAQVDAVPIVLDQSSPEYLGSIDPDGGSEATEAAQINVLIGLALNTVDFDDGDNVYNRSGNSCGTCPLATAVDSVKTDSDDNTGNFGSGFTYLKAKYGTLALIWYVAGLTGDFEIPSTVEGGGGLSHSVLFNPNVSEPSTTLLVGLAFVGLAFFGRKFLART